MLKTRDAKRFLCVQAGLPCRLRSARAFACGLAVVAGLTQLAAFAQGADEPRRAPATVAEAGKTLDLATFPLIDKADRLTSRRLAGLSYKVEGAVKGVFEAQRKPLTDRNWTELPNSYVSDQSASGSFTRDGFSLSLMVSPAGEPGMVNVEAHQPRECRDSASFPFPPE